jgi:hypothetical protein
MFAELCMDDVALRRHADGTRMQGNVLRMGAAVGFACMRLRFRYWLRLAVSFGTAKRCRACGIGGKTGERCQQRRTLAQWRWHGIVLLLSDGYGDEQHHA